ncbi:MAG: CoB--CoM heterodisulfide reductase subunit B [Promethearchaeota archaeon]|nr:MAG: CoB--CoM heterodisulfide reductase subunit B [Candidatus Lokiarchaeota archaeon]
MEIENLALNIEEIKKKYPDNPLEFFRGKRLCLFKACLEKYFPGVRFGIENLLEAFDMEVNICENQSCCSGTFFQRNLITRAQFAAINERNLSEINNQADILLVSCNGCYNSLLRGRDFLKIPEVRRKTQRILDEVEEKMGGETYPGQYKILENPNLRIVHDLDFIYLIRDQLLRVLKYDLKGLKVAVHYGCHYLNLERDRDVETYLKDKTKLEELVSLFGGTPVDYSERESCCGWGASQIVLHPEEALKVTYKKLKSAENVNACFLLMPCPTCLYTLSKPEFREKMCDIANDNLEIATIHLNELIAILRGCEEEQCVSLRRESPRIHLIYETITAED